MNPKKLMQPITADVVKVVTEVVDVIDAAVDVVDAVVDVSKRWSMWST
jgi:hypothetical protein